VAVPVNEVAVVRASNHKRALKAQDGDSHEPCSSGPRVEAKPVVCSVGGGANSAGGEGRERGLTEGVRSAFEESSGFGDKLGSVRGGGPGAGGRPRSEHRAIGARAQPGGRPTRSEDGQEGRAKPVDGLVPDGEVAPSAPAFHTGTGVAKTAHQQSAARRSQDGHGEQRPGLAADPALAPVQGDALGQLPRNASESWRSRDRKGYPSTSSGCSRSSRR
jgi:hypothetical protein